MRPIFQEKKTALSKTPTKTPSGSKKRYSNGSTKQAGSAENPIEILDYTLVLKELATAVNRTSPQRDVLSHWSEVLVDNIRQLPDDMQRETRHHIDGYVLGFLRSVKPYSMLTEQTDCGHYLPSPKKRPPSA